MKFEIGKEYVMREDTARTRSGRLRVIGINSVDGRVQCEILEGFEAKYEGGGISDCTFHPTSTIGCSLEEATPRREYPEFDTASFEALIS